MYACILSGLYFSTVVEFFYCGSKLYNFKLCLVSY